MKINKILAAGVAATLAVSALSAVASAEEHKKSWDMAYTQKSGSAEMNIAGYINKLYQDVEQAEQQMLVFDLGKDNGRKVTINGVEVTDFSFDGSPKMVVEGRKETGKNAVGDAVYQSVTREYTLAKFTRKDPNDKKDGNENKWAIAVLKDDEPTYKDGEFAPAFFDKIDKVSITYKVKLGNWTDKDQWNSKLKDKDVTVDVGNVYLYEITDDDNDNLPEYKTPVTTFFEGDKNYPDNLDKLVTESLKVGKGAAATYGAAYVMIKQTAIEDYTTAKNTYVIKNRKLSEFNGVAPDDGSKLAIGDYEVEFPADIGDDDSDWTLEYDSLGRPVAILVKLADDAQAAPHKTTIKNVKTGDVLNGGDTYRIDIHQTTWYENNGLKENGKNIKFAVSAVELVKHNATYGVDFTGADGKGKTADDPILYDVDGKKVVINADGDAAAVNYKNGEVATGMYTAGVAADDGQDPVQDDGDHDAANDAIMWIDPTAKQSVANTASHIIAYATVDGGWKPSEFSYTPQPTSKVNWDSKDVYPLLYQTTANPTILRNDVWLLSDAADYKALTINGNGIAAIGQDFADQSYKDDDKPEGTKPFRFAGMASQFGDFFNITDNPGKNGKVIFRFSPTQAASDDWKSGGVPSSETGLKNALGSSSFGLFVNYKSSTGQLQTPGIVDEEEKTVTFDVSEILNDMGGLTKGNVTDIYYGLNKGLNYDGKFGYYVEEVIFTFDDAPAAVDANTDDDADDDAAVVVADDDDDDDVVADDDDDDIAADDDIIEDDDDDDDDAGEIIADDDDDDDNVNNEVDYVDADDDANPGTGVGLAVIPAIVAGAALVVSKKRK